MSVLLFTTKNCRSCDKHRRSVIALAKFLGVSVNVYDVDDARYFQATLRAMKLYGVTKMPSTVVLDEFRNVVGIVHGIRNSIATIEKLITHEEV